MGMLAEPTMGWAAAAETANNSNIAVALFFISYLLLTVQQPPRVCPAHPAIRKDARIMPRHPAADNIISAS
jgi:hypothetical protein